MKAVKRIDTIKPIIDKKKVCAYARVSMDTDRLKHSLSSQVSYYSKLIQSNPEWEYKGVYSDYGISGISTVKREGFKEMLEECDKGNIDIILTKSIKRFSRNTVDLLKTVRQLKAKGIEVRFETENINSLSGDGELMLSILASFAQEESRSISDNVKWGTVKRFKEGIPNGKFSIYGYRWEGDNLVIIEEEANIVRRIYKEYLEGKSRIQIGRILDNEGIKTRRGNRWTDSNIKVILTNIHYTGNLLFQKEFVVDPISGKTRKNRGELPQYFVEDTHEPIISMEDFRKVEMEMKRRYEAGAFGNPAIPTTALTGKIRCPHCGKNFYSGIRKQKVGKVKIWMCANRKNGKPCSCNTGEIQNKIIEDILCETLKIESLDDNQIKEKLDHIDVIKKEKLIIHFTSGEIIETPYRTMDKKVIFTDEIKANISSKLRNKHCCNRKNIATPFTGLIECARCGNLFGSQKNILKTGENVRYLSCKSKRTKCPKNSIQETTLKKLTCDVLELEEFDEKIMDAVIERIYISDNTVRFNFKNGHEETRTYLEKKRGTPCSKERREKLLPKMAEYCNIVK